jgi:hypothetical protein
VIRSLAEYAELPSVTEAPDVPDAPCVHAWVKQLGAPSVTYGDAWAGGGGGKGKWGKV